MILSCVRRIKDHLGYYVGKPTVVRTLQGSREKKTMELGLNEISTYGLLKTMSANAIKELISRLEDGGYLVTELEHQTLRLTEKSSNVLYLGEPVEVLMLKQEEKLQRLDDDGMTEDERELFDLLREHPGAAKEDSETANRFWVESEGMRHVFDESRENIYVGAYDPLLPKEDR